MAIKLGDIVPNFYAGFPLAADYHSWLNKGWGIILSHPEDVFTKIYDQHILSGLTEELEKRGVRPVIFVESKDNKAFYPNAGLENKVTILSLKQDNDLASLFLNRGLTASGNSLSKIFIVDPNKIVRSILSYSPFTSRNIDEMLSIWDAIRLSEAQVEGNSEEVLIAPNDHHKKSYLFNYSTRTLKATA